MSKPAPEGAINPGKSITQVALDVVADGRMHVLPGELDHHLQPVAGATSRTGASRASCGGATRFPAWYAEDGRVFVAKSEAERRRAARARPAWTGRWTRDPDVLDTWFSSALVPFTDAGLAREHARPGSASLPSSVLVTGFDIIFFWVARMVMMTTHLIGEIPVQARVRAWPDPRRRRPEDELKSKGNTLDPGGPDRRHRPGSRWWPSAPSG